MDLLTRSEIKAGMTLNDLSEQEILRRKELNKRVNNFFKSLDRFNKLSQTEKSKRMAICKV